MAESGMDSVDWVAAHAASLDTATGTVVETHHLTALDARLAGARIIVLGETNHFVREKTDFRLFWLNRIQRQLAGDRPIVVGEELGWADGRRVRAYLDQGDEAELARAATFGGTAQRRSDRDDASSGIFAESIAAYPHQAMRREHLRFYRYLRALGIRAYFGFDVDAPGGGYADIRALRQQAEALGLPDQFWQELARVPGESADQEALRLERLGAVYGAKAGYQLLRPDLESLVESLRYTAMVSSAADYEATRPAMAFREDTMKRRLDLVLDQAPAGSLIVLLDHAFHLARDDSGMQGGGIGPGGGLSTSLGHYLSQDRGLDVGSIWMLYGSGMDSQPLKDLPSRADFPAGALNQMLAAREGSFVLPLTDGCPWSRVGVGHMYNRVEQVDLVRQADAVHFVQTVSPL